MEQQSRPKYIFKSPDLTSEWTNIIIFVNIMTIIASVFSLADKTRAGKAGGARIVCERRVVKQVRGEWPLAQSAVRAFPRTSVRGTCSPSVKLSATFV